jgi:molecular chaperone GrpE
MTEENAPDTPDGPEPAQVESGESTLSENQLAELEEALREKDQFKAMAQRAQADLINYRRRVEDEREELRRSANTGLILRILTVVDDLERAMALVPDDAVAPGWMEGLQLVQRNLQNLLDAEGVTKIEAEGKPFQPWEHESVLYEETTESEEGLVVRVFRDGYRQHDRVVRPAQVSVAKAPEPQQQAETTQPETEQPETEQEEA